MARGMAVISLGCGVSTPLVAPNRRGLRPANRPSIYVSSPSRLNRGAKAAFRVSVQRVVGSALGGVGVRTVARARRRVAPTGPNKVAGAGVCQAPSASRCG